MKPAVEIDALRDGGQYRLQLFTGSPWDGLSPRVLTRRFILLFLRQKPPRHEVFFDPEQIEIWPGLFGHQKERPPPKLSVGAPLLQEVERRR